MSARIRKKVPEPGLLAIQLPPVMATHKFTISDEAHALLAGYASFMSERMGKEVSADHVIESLAATLRSIPEFQNWRTK
jgi:hypothetical protein